MLGCENNERDEKECDQREKNEKACEKRERVETKSGLIVLFGMWEREEREICLSLFG